MGARVGVDDGGTSESLEVRDCCEALTSGSGSAGFFSI